MLPDETVSLKTGGAKAVSAPPSKLGRYEILEVLGQGGMGIVYLAKDPHLDKEVAIKTMRIAGLSQFETEEFLKRFRAEARVVAKLQHPNIVTVYNAEYDAGMPYIVMEMIEGDDLEKKLSLIGRLEVIEAAAVMGQLLEALEYAHQRGIVHRDIKPSNILLDANNQVKLVDFGVAKIVLEKNDETRTISALAGSMRYMPPEQIEQAPANKSFDIWAASVVFYKMLTGKHPFEGGDRFAHNILNQAVTAPSIYRKELAPAVDKLLAKALSKDPKQRYPTAREFAAAIQEASDISGTSVRPQYSSVAGKLVIGACFVAAASVVWYLIEKPDVHRASKSAELQAAAPVNAPIATFTRFDKEWDVRLSFPNPTLGISWRLLQTGPFRETGFMDEFDISTRKRMPNNSFNLPGDTDATTIEVRYIDTSGEIQGPFSIKFDPEAELIRDFRRRLEMTSSSWLQFNVFIYDLVIMTGNLVSNRCAIRQVRLGIDSAVPDKVLELPACDIKNPLGTTPLDPSPMLKLPPGTKSVSVELTYRDGSVSEIKTFRR